MKNSETLSIEGMHCGACVRRVTTAIQNIEGVTIDSVEVGSAAIQLDPATASLEQVTSALDRIGFHATAVR